MRIPALRFFAMPALLLGLFLAACHLGDDKQVEATLTFNQWYDSLSQYERVVISLKDEGGNTIDVLFDGQVKVPGDLEKLPAPHWDGSNTTVSIVGYKGGAIVYRTETGFNGNSGKKDSTYVIIAPDIGISTLARALPMLEGDSMNLPEITIVPSKLKVKDLTWTSSAPDVVAVGKTGFRALKAGTALITVALAGDATKSLVITITVVDPAKIPESIALSADTLKLSAGGSPDKLGVTFVPTTSAKDLIWTVRNTEIASVAADGTVEGLKAGETYLVATSSLKASVSDSALLIVSTPVPPLKVVFAKVETEIFVGGAAESLMVAIEPPEANQDVEFSVTSATHLEVKNGRVSGLAEGAAEVIAKSKANPDLADTLKVKITVKQVINSVAISRKTLTIFTGGEETVLTASVLPATSNAKVDWRSSNAAAATVENGKLTAVAPGFTRIRAISVADSSKQDSADVTVKTDAPVVNIGRPDTTVSLGSTVAFLPVVPTQEYGVVVAYRWDVDGAAGWDDTAKAVQSVSVKFDQEKEYTLRFYVRDSEGNETIAIKKVTAVNGPVVTIVSPVDGAYFTKPAIKIEWKIDNVAQTTGLDTVLKDGANVITRSAKDGAGKVFSTQITVYLDSVPPAKPLVKGPAAIASGKPMWTWGPGGGGNGIYRIAVDSQVFAGAGSKDTLYIPEPALSEGTHTLYVQERDAAGNWSLPGSVTTVVDGTGPTKPTVRTNVASPTNTKRPVWSWTSGGGGSGIFQYKMGSSDFSTGASTPAVDSTYTPTANLGDGTYTLYVRERDALGNWSEPGSAALAVDTTAPGKPSLLATSPTSLAPKWTWTSGGGGNGTFRFKVNSEPSGAPETTLREYTHAGAVSKTLYTLFVQERDAVGNWSPVAELGVFFDLSKPTVAFTAPQISGTYMTKSATVDVAGTSTSPAGGGAIQSVAYTIDGVAGNLPTNLAGDGSWSIKALPLTNNKTIALKVTVTNEANNTGEATLNILMDNTPPATPSFTAQPPLIVNKADTRTSLAWTWSRTGDATDSFVVKLNGAEVARQTTLTYTVNSFADGEYQLEVVEKDLTGNTSSPQTSVKTTVDRVSPSTPAFATQPPLVVNKTDTRTSLQWTWNRTGAATDSFLVSLNGALVSRQVGTSYTVTPIPDGTYQIEVVEKDVAGNNSNGVSSNTTIVDRSSPTTPSFSSQPPAIVNKTDSRTSLVWQWTRTGDATDSFLVSLNGSPVSRQTGTSYTANNISDGEYQIEVVEKDLNGNQSGTLTSTKVLVDRTSPNAPNLSQPASPRRTAQWTWETGGGGNGSFQCLLDGASTPSSCTSPYNLPSPTDGDHTLRVRELDAAGNASAYSATTVTIDLQKPVINLANAWKQVPAQIFNSIPDFTGTVSDERQLKSVHAVWGSDSTVASGASSSGTSTWTVTPSIPSGTRTLTFRAQDVAGNQAEIQITVTYEPLVIFVRSGATSGKDGSSWENAYPDLKPLLESGKTYKSGTQFWVSEGTYTSHDDKGFLMRSNTSVYGGFNSEGTDRSLAGRDVVNNISIMKPGANTGNVISNHYQLQDGSEMFEDNVRLSNFRLSNGDHTGGSLISVSNANQVTLSGLYARQESVYNGIDIYNSKVEIFDTNLELLQAIEGVIRIQGNSTYVRVKYSGLKYNHALSFSGAIQVDYGQICLGAGTAIQENDPRSVHGNFSMESTGVTIDPNSTDGTVTTVGSCPVPF